MSGDNVAYKVQINLPHLPKGHPVQIAGLGTFENGSSYDISREEADRYRTFHSRLSPVYDEESGALLGSEREIGPTLLEAFKSTNGIEVSTGSPRRSESSNSNSDDKNEGGESQ